MKSKVKKKKTCSNPEEVQLFHDAVKGVNRIEQDKIIIEKPQKKPKFQDSINPFSQKNFRYTGEILRENIASNDWIDAEESTHYGRDTLHYRTLRQLKRGQVSIDVKLDLHSFTGDEAVAALTHFLLKSQDNQNRVLLIVHGKGQPGKDGAILKNIVLQWLRQQPEVLAIESAHARHGGSGAVYVIIRRKKI